MTRTLLGAALVLLALCAAQARAAPDPLPNSLRHCAAEQDPARRLACFDALAAALPKLEADRFGMNAAIVEKRTPGAEAREQSQVLPGKIAALRQSGRGELIFTLDNGQVWMQVEPQPRISFAVGEAIRIEHGALGTLWLAADHARKTKIRRIS
jgi:hypothetical protein